MGLVKYIERQELAALTGMTVGTSRDITEELEEVSVKSAPGLQGRHESAPEGFASLTTRATRNCFRYSLPGLRAYAR